MNEQQQLWTDLKTALQQWKLAQEHFAYATDADQIECSIYAVDLAEKRYQMYLRQAKQLDWQQFPENWGNLLC